MNRSTWLAALAFAWSPLLARSGAAQEPPSSTLEAGLSASIRPSEYHFSAVAAEPGVLSAPNRGQELRSRVSAHGLEVFSRATPASGLGAEWRLTLRTKSFGREGFAEELAPATVTTNGARVELAHGALTEWFENRPEGIEQGWTIATAPSGAERLWIGLELGGELALRIDSGSRSGVFVDGPGTPKLRYRDLRAWDASGRELAAQLLPSPTGVGIALDTLGAVYPLTVDPLVTGPTWTAESDQASAHFGDSVAAAGDVNGDGFSDVIVGASSYDNGESDEGRAFVFLGSVSGLAAGAAWTAEGDQAGAAFGYPVSTAGDVNGDGYSDVLVGAGSYDNGQTNEGRAFLYLGSASGPAPTPSWTAESDQVGAGFGAVSTAGDVNGDGYSDVIVGAPSHDNGQSDEGRVFVYLGSASGLAASAAWTAESDQASSTFGEAVSPAGDVNGDGYGDVLVGARLFDNGESNEGGAFVYLGSASGLAASAAWSAESNQVDAWFGITVSTAGDVNGDGYGDVLVGAISYDNGEFDEGSAFVYAGSASGLASSPTWTLEPDQALAESGAAVSTAGDVNGDGYSDVIVGARRFDNGEFDEGGAFVYLGSASGLSSSPTWTAESGQTSPFFGAAVSTAGDVNGDGYSDVIVGAYNFDNGQTDEGRAYVYHGGPGTLLTTPAWTAEPNSQSASVQSVGAAGDVNGDGFGDVLWGSYLYTNNQTQEGAGFSFLGSEVGLSVTPDWLVESNQVQSYFGLSIASAGDVNGDGYSDVIVGALNYDNGESDEGRAFLYLGSPSGLDTAPSWISEVNINGAQYGDSVASAGDVDGDGFGDVIVAASGVDNGQVNEGVAYVYRGSSAGLEAVASWTIESDQDVAGFNSAAGAGDVNGDGFSDVLVGYNLYDNGQPNEGKAEVYFGSASGLSALPAWSWESDQAHARAGYPVSFAGDVNGDGFSDVVLGAFGYDNGEAEEGMAFLFLGSVTGPASSPSWTAEGNQAQALFAYSISGAGDVNGDGYSDVVVGALGYDDAPNNNRGRAYLYLGTPSGLPPTPAWSTVGDQNNAQYGSSVADAGDVNGDGYGDVIIASFSYDNGSIDEGRAFLYYGNESGSPTLRPRQRRVNSGPLDVLDASDRSYGFQLSVEFDRDLAGQNWSSPGTTSARLQWEVAPLGGTFDGIPDGESLPQTITGATLSFDELVGGLVPDTLYHWRARIATTNPLYPNTPWFTVQGRPVTEAKFRTKNANIRPTTGAPAAGGTRSVP